MQAPFDPEKAAPTVAFFDGADLCLWDFFSLSLTVKDLQASREFYEQLGFVNIGGNAVHNYLIMRHGTVTIGLFQDMFDENLMTFNPGWNEDAQPVDDFEDVRALQARLKAAGVALTREADPDGTGPDHIVLADPDGNTIMFDQHVDKP